MKGQQVIERFRSVLDVGDQVPIIARTLYRKLAAGEYCVGEYSYKYDDLFEEGEFFVQHPVHGFEVSTHGRIRGPSKRITKGYLSNGGYRSFKHAGKPYLVHRLVAETFHENTDLKEQVDHINRIKNDNRMVNLRWVTPTENSRNRPSVYEKQKHPCPCCTCFDFKK